jgi:2-isopropylmalate synthase
MGRLGEMGFDIDASDPRVVGLLDQIKEREFLGYSYDGAEASLEMLARRALGKVETFFKVDGFRVSVERRHNALGEEVTVSEAVVKVVVDGERIMNVGEGNGPVNALDNALRKDLGRFSKWLEDLKLVDYKVRILTAGTEAVTRVMIESADSSGNRWSTVGVSANIVDASFEALIDSITYKLLRDRAPAVGIDGRS